MALSLSATAGWGSYAIVRHTSAAVEHQLRDQVTSLQTAQTQLVAEQTKAQVSLSEMAQLRGELVTARQEINWLSQGRIKS
jgi:flagellar hook-basal body complex protein FliE